MQVYASLESFFLKLLNLIGDFISDNFDNDCANARRKQKTIVS